MAANCLDLQHFALPPVDNGSEVLAKYRATQFMLEGVEGYMTCGKCRAALTLAGHVLVPEDHYLKVGRPLISRSWQPIGAQTECNAAVLGEGVGADFLGTCPPIRPVGAVAVALGGIPVHMVGGKTRSTRCRTTS